jgi:pilus assembly protein Flp/PilA
MKQLLEFLKIQLDGRIAKTERGASAVEYGLLVALIAVIILLAVLFLGHTLSNIFHNSANSIATAS